MADARAIAEPNTITLVIGVKMDEQKLDDYTRSLWEGPPDDPYPGYYDEEHPGRGLLADWIGELKAGIERRDSIDTLWFEPSNDYVDEVTVEVIPARAEVASDA